MRCPRCGTENGTRSVCTKCGMFLVDTRSKNRRKMTAHEIKKQDMNTLWRFAKQFIKFLALLFILLIISVLIIIAIQYFAG